MSAKVLLANFDSRQNDAKLPDTANILTWFTDRGTFKYHVSMSSLIANEL